MRALRSKTDVTVDLSQLVFADPTLMLDLAALARRMRVNGCKILLVGAQPQIMALIEEVGLHRLAGVRLESRSRALA